MNISKLKDIVKIRKKFRDDLRRAPHNKMELTPEEMQYCNNDILAINDIKRSDAFDEIRD